MNFLSVCSGIEAASVAWNPLGWKAAAFAEIESFPCAVLAHHYPDVPNLGDMTKFKDWPDHAIDLLCGGTPCQSFSVAGLRAGLADPRGDLMLTFLAIAARYRPKWVVWENVPGVLSSNGGRDFGAFLGGLAVCGYGFAYRVLDAQYFGVAQRRRRVFVVGCLGDWRSAAAVLFERHSLQGHPAPRRQSGKGVTGTLTRSALNGSGATGGDGRDTFMIPQPAELLCVATGQAGADMGADMAPTLNCNHEAPYIAGVAHSLRGEGFDASEDGTGRGTPLGPVAGQPIAFDTTQITSKANFSNPRAGDTGHPLAAQAHVPAIAFKTGQSEAAGGIFVTEEYAPTLQAANNGSTAGMQVRRLTPRECARLQGFPDDYLDITYRGKPAADGSKYKALGNSWAVPVAAWVGKRIMEVEAITP